VAGGRPHAERSLQELRDLIARENHLAVGYVVRCIEVMLAIRAGRFAEAETLAQTCLQRGQEAGDADATGWFGGQMVAIRWYQGRLGELLPMLRTMVNSPTLSATDSSHVISLAVAAATVGERREAAGALARVAGGGLARLPRSSSWLVSMYGIAEATHLLGDVETATAAYELLRPFSGLPLVGGIGVACFGSVQHALGVASLTSGHVQRAVDHFRCAVSENLALGHWPATVLSRVRLAEALVLRVESADVWGTELVAEADQALDQATREAVGLEMALPPSVADLRSRLTRAAARGAGSQRGAVRGVAGVAPRVAFQRVGRQWQVAFGHRTALVDHSVGMRYLAVLTANPGYEVPAIELAAGAGQSAEVVADRAGSSHQPVLDEVAMREYRQRLASLADEIDKYELSNDLGRAEVARAERDWLIAELTAAAGLGGRVREFSSGEERARISVGKAIRRALERISTVDPTIGAELRATIQTGLRCCYQPR
jgi:hypothetical protein